jgi:hypothetical protein
MNTETLKKEDFVDYSRLINIQFVDFARSEVISNEEAHARFLSSFIERYGPPLGGPEILEHVLDGKMVLPSKICVTCVKEYMHCPLICIFNSLMPDGLNPELIDASNKIVARALVS